MNHFWISLPLTFNLFMGLLCRPHHVVVCIGRNTNYFSCDQRTFFGKVLQLGEGPLGEGPLGKFDLIFYDVCHFEWQLLSISVCSIVVLRDKSLHYYKNADSGRSRATLIFFLARLGAKMYVKTVGYSLHVKPCTIQLLPKWKSLLHDLVQLSKGLEFDS